MTWDLVDRIRRRIDIPLIVKGIATAEDAKLAVEHGVDVVYVSNHGGRQLDHGRGCIEVLPEVIEAVQGKAEVVIDGGFCRGTDILKAMERAVRKVERDIAARLRPGVRGVDLHARALKMFARVGFETGRAGGKARGFFHGIGHGLGLEIHERPSLSAREERLQKGDVVTVEPGLYYPERGGIRHENVYLITDRGARCLTRCDMPFEII